MRWDDQLGRRLKLRDLQTLMAVIEAGGIGKAADRLNYSQPAISKAIAGLERTLGKRLFERGRNGIELTPYGEAMLKCGTAVFDDLRKGIADIEFLSDPSAGDVRIGCSEPVSVGLVSKVIDRLSRKHQRIAFDVAVNNPEAICEELVARKLDFAITQIVDSMSNERLFTETIYDDPVVVVAARGHPAAKKRAVKLDDLVSARWVLPPADSFISGVLSEAFDARGLNGPVRTVTTHSVFLRIMLAANGHFLTVLPAAMLNHGLRQLSIKALPVELLGNRRPVGIVTLKNRSLSPVAQLFVEHTRAIAKALV